VKAATNRHRERKIYPFDSQRSCARRKA